MGATASIYEVVTSYALPAPHQGSSSASSRAGTTIYYSDSITTQTRSSFSWLSFLRRLRLASSSDTGGSDGRSSAHIPALRAPVFAWRVTHIDPDSPLASLRPALVPLLTFLTHVNGVPVPADTDELAAALHRAAAEAATAVSGRAGAFTLCFYCVVTHTARLISVPVPPSVPCPSPTAAITPSPPAPASPLPPSWRGLGLRVEPGAPLRACRGAVAVVAVAPRSPAYYAGIKAGDFVLGAPPGAALGLVPAGAAAGASDEAEVALAMEHAPVSQGGALVAFPEPLSKSYLDDDDDDDGEDDSQGGRGRLGVGAAVAALERVLQGLDAEPLDAEAENGAMDAVTSQTPTADAADLTAQSQPQQQQQQQQRWQPRMVGVYVYRPPARDAAAGAAAAAAGVGGGEVWVAALQPKRIRARRGRGKGDSKGGRGLYVGAVAAEGPTHQLPRFMSYSAPAPAAGEAEEGVTVVTSITGAPPAPAAGAVTGAGTASSGATTLAYLSLPAARFSPDENSSGANDDDEEEGAAVSAFFSSPLFPSTAPPTAATTAAAVGPSLPSAAPPSSASQALPSSWLPLQGNNSAAALAAAATAAASAARGAVHGQTRPPKQQPNLPQPQQPQQPPRWVTFDPVGASMVAAAIAKENARAFALAASGGDHEDGSDDDDDDSSEKSDEARDARAAREARSAAAGDVEAGAAGTGTSGVAQDADAASARAASSAGLWSRLWAQPSDPSPADASEAATAPSAPLRIPALPLPLPLPPAAASLKTRPSRRGSVGSSSSVVGSTSSSSVGSTSSSSVGSSGVGSTSSAADHKEGEGPALEGGARSRAGSIAGAAAAPGVSAASVGAPQGASGSGRGCFNANASAANTKGPGSISTVALFALATSPLFPVSTSRAPITVPAVPVAFTADIPAATAAPAAAAAPAAGDSAVLQSSAEDPPSTVAALAMPQLPCSPFAPVAGAAARAPARSLAPLLALVARAADNARRGSA